MTEIKFALFEIAPARLRPLIGTAAAKFLRKPATELKVQPDPKIVRLAESKPEQFTATFCSVITSHQHQFLNFHHIINALTSSEVFGRYNANY